MIRLCIAAAAVLLMTCALLGDVAPDPLITGGATVSAKDAKGTPVAMVWEEVDLYPSAEKNAVTAVFVLRNTSDKETSLEVGFPSNGQMSLRGFPNLCELFDKSS
jgi:hypothetical protein